MRRKAPESQDFSSYVIGQERKRDLVGGLLLLFFAGPENKGCWYGRQRMPVLSPGAAASVGGLGGPERSRFARPARVCLKSRKAGKAPGSFHVSSLPMAWFASWSFLACRLKRAAKHCTLRGGNFRRFRSQFAVNLQSPPILIRRVTINQLLKGKSSLTSSWTFRFPMEKKSGFSSTWNPSRNTIPDMQ